jgi:hypothetical protein
MPTTAPETPNDLDEYENWGKPSSKKNLVKVQKILEAVQIIDETVQNLIILVQKMDYNKTNRKMKHVEDKFRENFIRRITEEVNQIKRNAEEIAIHLFEAIKEVERKIDNLREIAERKVENQ